MIFVKTARKLAASFLVVTSVVLAQGAFSGVALAEKTPTVVLVADMNAVFGASDVGQDIARQVREQAEALLTEDTAVREALTAEAELLRSQRDTLTEEKLQEVLNDLTQRQQAHVQRIGLRQQALQLGQSQAQAEVAAVVKPIFSELLVKHGAGLLINQSAVIAGGLDLNITAEAIAMLNERLAKITVTPVDPATLSSNQ